LCICPSSFKTHLDNIDDVNEEVIYFYLVLAYLEGYLNYYTGSIHDSHSAVQGGVEKSTKNKFGSL
jgi:hypothetical protein